jgi:hypothetical protein
MKIKRPKKDNLMLQKKDNDFMKDSYNEASAEYILKDRVNMFDSKEAFINHASKRGYLKTEKDKKIVESVLKKSGLKSNPNLKKKRRCH